jgi:hypothetical protein
MKVIYTAGARSDLDEIGEWLSDHYPTIAHPQSSMFRGHCPIVG